MTTVYLALGSNIGNPCKQIKTAVDLLGEVLDGLKQAPVYRSKAVGFRRQPDFLNTAVSGRTGLEPEDLLDRLKAIEAQVGRTSTFRNGPREIDIDLVMYGDRVMETPKLSLPHPRFRERDFVLRPLKDLNPELLDPVSHSSIEQLLAELKPEQRSIID